MTQPLKMTGYNMATKKEMKDYAISRKIIKLMREGFPQKQAAAIAIRMYKDGELNIPGQKKKKKKTKEQKFKERRQRQRRYQAKESKRRRGY